MRDAERIGFVAVMAVLLVVMGCMVSIHAEDVKRILDQHDAIVALQDRTETLKLMLDARPPFTAPIAEKDRYVCKHPRKGRRCKKWIKATTTNPASQ